MGGFLGALGGIGQGISAGTQDLERMDQAAFLKQQQAHQKMEWGDEDAARTAIDSLDPTDDAPTRAKALAAVYTKSKSPKLQAQGLQMEATARQFSREEITDRAARMAELAKNAAWLHETGNSAGALRVLQGAYDLFPDQRRVVVDDTNNTWGVAGPSGKWEVQPMPITPESVGQAVNMGMKFGNPNLWSEYRKDRRDERKVDQGDRKLGIEETEVNAKVPLFSAQAREADAKVPLFGAQGNEANAKAEYYRGRIGIEGREAKNPYTMGAPIQAVDEDGNTTYSVPVFNKNTGQVEFKQQAAPQGTRSVNDKLRGNIERDWVKMETELRKNGTPEPEIQQQRNGFLSARGIAPPAAQAVMASGINPKTKKPLTAAEVEAFNQRYPRSAVDPAKVLRGATKPAPSGGMGINTAPPGMRAPSFAQDPNSVASMVQRLGLQQELADELQNRRGLNKPY